MNTSPGARKKEERYVPLEQIDCLLVHVLAVVQIQELAEFLVQEESVDWINLCPRA